MSADRSAGGVCPSCGLAYAGGPGRCLRCGTLHPDAVADIRRRGDDARRGVHARKAQADLLFLAGLLLGGPAVTFWGHALAGAVVILAGGAASVLRRYTEWSTVGTLVAGVGAALAVAAWVFEPVGDAIDETRATEAARAAYAEAIAAQDADVYVEARGPALVAIWFEVPDADAGACGDYPDARVRRHLAELGFLRVVVAVRNRAGGLCSFPP
jgi:hypothetical protein